jgi:hypothetical protein
MVGFILNSDLEYKKQIFQTMRGKINFLIFSISYVIDNLSLFLLFQLLITDNVFLG